MRDFLLLLGRTLLFSLLSFAFPRFLVAVGVPLYRWAFEFAEYSKLTFLTFDVLLWGFVLFSTLLMLWAESRYSLLERLLYAGRPTKIKPADVHKFESLIADAEDLINEGMRINPKADWAGRVVQWNLSAESLVSESLPQTELMSFKTVNLAPATGQPAQLTIQLLVGRRNKLRKMLMRLLPKKWP